MTKYLTIIFSFFSISFFAQKECELPDNGKVKKLYEKALDRKKTKDPEKRQEFMKEAIEEDERSS